MSVPEPSSPGAAIVATLGLEAHPIEGLDARADEPMRRHTTLRLGGPADLWCVPQHEVALSELLARAHGAGLPVSFVGGGTNLLVRDGGIRGVVIHLRRLNAVREVEEVDGGDATLVEAEAGASTGRVLQFALQRELGGVEFLAGVPGTLGGGLIMNAGTYLGEFTDVVQTVRSVRLDGTAVVRAHAECGFRYRASDLPREELVISATMRLPRRDPATMEAAIAELRAHRKAREPMGVPNNGSTFKNPPGDHAGRLIEAAGLKGLRVGGAVVSPKHANWLVVDRDVEPPCTSRDLMTLIELVRARVETHAGVTLEREVKIIGVD